MLVRLGQMKLDARNPNSKLEIKISGMMPTDYDGCRQITKDAARKGLTCTDHEYFARIPTDAGRFGRIPTDPARAAAVKVPNKPLTPGKTSCLL